MPTASQLLPRIRKLRALAAATSCPVERASQAVGGRWRLLSLRTPLLRPDPDRQRTER